MMEPAPSDHGLDCNRSIIRFTTTSPNLLSRCHSGFTAISFPFFLVRTGSLCLAQGFSSLGHVLDPVALLVTALWVSQALVACSQTESPNEIRKSDKTVVASVCVVDEAIGVSPDPRITCTRTVH